MHILHAQVVLETTTSPTENVVDNVIIRRRPVLLQERKSAEAVDVLKVVGIVVGRLDIRRSNAFVEEQFHLFHRGENRRIVRLKDGMGLGSKRCSDIDMYCDVR